MSGFSNSAFEAPILWPTVSGLRISNHMHRNLGLVILLLKPLKFVKKFPHEKKHHTVRRLSLVRSLNNEWPTSFVVQLTRANYVFKLVQVKREYQMAFCAIKKSDKLRSLTGRNIFIIWNTICLKGFSQVFFCAFWYFKRVFDSECRRYGTFTCAKVKNKKHQGKQRYAEP